MTIHYVYFGTSYSQNEGKDNKIGRSQYLNDRLQNLDTSYSRYGFFIKSLIICDSIENSEEIENYLHIYFWDYSTTKLDNITSSGTEWFNKDITDKEIENALIEGNYDNKIITDKDKIDKLTEKSKRDEIIKNHIKKMNQKSFERKEKLVKIKARDYQKKTELLNYYKNNDKGILNWCCGLGKSFMTLLYIEHYNFNKILIGVPSIILQEHWEDEIKKYFNNYKIIFVGGNKCKNEKEINDYFNKYNKLIIISTYASCKKILNYNVKFNFKVGDEAHHLIGDNKEYNNFHNIKANKELYLTATMKELTNSNRYSMDNTEQFGNIIDKKSINWAINNKYIVDYELALINYDIDIDIILRKINCNYIENKELLISAYLILKSISLYDDLNNIFVYTNTTDNADLVTKYIDILINTSTLFPELNEIKNQIYNKAYHSKSIIFDLKSKEVLKNKIIITSIVYSLGEGFNYPELNGVCFAENMMSNIRIIQSLLRPHRIDKENPNKKAKVLIPFNINDLNNKESNIYTISKQLRNEDKNIKQRIKLIENKTSIQLNPYQNPNKISYDILIENPNKLREILIKLESSLNKYFKDLEEEYKHIQKINKKLKLESKEEYINNQEKHNNYIDNPIEYFSTCWNNWYVFLEYDTENFIQSKDDWIKFCKEKGLNNYNEYLELCKDFKQLPKMPEEFYKDYTNFNNELNLNRKRR